MSRIRRKNALSLRSIVIACAVIAAASGLGCSDDSASGTGEASGSAGAGTKSGPSSPAPAGTTATPPKSAGPDSRSAEELVSAGRSVYNANCIACHGMDPTKDGALGPAVAGASPALLEARVLYATYPDGYVPKRPSRVMVALPHLESKLPELAAYLDSLD